MPYQNDGYQRATTLTIIVKLNGNFQSNNVFPLMAAFTYNGVNYPALTPTAIQQMVTSDYTARATAYSSYIQANYQSQFPGLVVSSTGSRVENTLACPLP